jgi:hypothetical protein
VKDDVPTVKDDILGCTDHIPCAQDYISGASVDISTV